MSKKINIQAKLTIIDHDSIAKYLHEIRIDKSTKPLLKQDEVNLFNQYKLSGDPKVKELIIKANLRWVISVAKQYSYPKIKLQDLINEGNIGMIDAIDRFDISRGVSFITFATNYIRLAITSYINDVAMDIPQPANRYRINKLIKKSISDLKLMGIVEPTDENIVKHYTLIKKPTDPKMSTLLLNDIRNNSKDFVSMHTKVSDTDDAIELSDTFETQNNWRADHNLITKEKKNIAYNHLSKLLTDKQLQIVTMSFGLNDYEPHTNEQIGEILGYTRERIGQILKTSIDVLKHHKKLMFEVLGSTTDTSTIETYN